MADRASFRGRVLALGTIVIVVAGFLSTSPIPQDPAYHRFADGRSFLGIPNAWNVLSNLPFLYWAATEHRGIGDLRPYAVVQFLPMLLIPVILVAWRSSSAMAGYFWLMILFYVLAKGCEYYDAGIFEMTGIVSGHTFKHLFASLAPAMLLLALIHEQSATVRDACASDPVRPSRHRSI